MPSSQYSRNDNNDKHHRQYQQQTARLIPARLLIPARAPQLHIGLFRIPPHILHIRIDRIQLIALLPHNMRHVPEQLIQFPNALLDIPNL